MCFVDVGQLEHKAFPDEQSWSDSGLVSTLLPLRLGSHDQDYKSGSLVASHLEDSLLKEGLDPMLLRHHEFL